MLPQSSYAQNASVMPKLQVQQVPDGFLIYDKAKRSTQAIIIIIFAVAWNAISCPLFFLLQRESRASIFATILPLIFFIIGLLVFVLAIYTILQLYLFRPGSLHVPRLPLRLGETVPVRFQQSTRSLISVQQLEARLACLEWVRYTVGTDTRTATHILWEQPLENQPLFSNSNGVDRQWMIHVSPQLPPSFDSSNNAIKWIIEVKVKARWIKGTSEFTLPVLPEVVQ